jgi:hypothetical protein
MEKQTAVEWIIREIIRHQMSFYGTSSIPLYIIEQAKRMEREQIINAFSEGTRMKDINDELSARFNACLYYVQTYGGQDEK